MNLKDNDSSLYEKYKVSCVFSKLHSNEICFFNDIVFIHRKFVKKSDDLYSFGYLHLQHYLLSLARLSGYDGFLDMKIKKRT